jgi:hypothetical protein
MLRQLSSKLTYKIIVPEEFTYEQVLQEINLGGRFVVYPYCISILFAVTLKRLSPAYFIGSNKATLSFKSKYNRISCLLGIWAIPWGIMTAIEYVKLNNKGGLDVTEDILLNLDEQNFASHDVDIKFISKIFKVPQPSEIKAMQQVLKRCAITQTIEQLYFGQFLNTNRSGSYFILGIQTKHNYQETCAALLKASTKEFYSNVLFDFLDLTGGAEEIPKLKVQGFRMI